MSAAPRVSVVMPFIDLEAFLAESIDSVIAQTYPDWELLLIDDGSKDASGAIARSYAARFPERIRYLSHEGGANLGASVSRNLGIRHARGEYIALLDGDDVWLPHKLAEQVAMLDAMPEAGALYGRTLWWYSWTGALADRKRDRTQPLGVRPDSLLPPPLLLVRALRDRAPLPCTCSIIMRRQVVEATGGFEPEFRRVYTDQAFYAKLLLATPIYVSGRCWDRYRQHPRSSIFVATAAGEVHPELPHPARYVFLEWLERYLDRHGLRDTEVWRALQHQLWLYRHPALHRTLKQMQSVPDRMKRAFWEVGVSGAFRIGRRVLPAALRERLWARLGSRF